MYIKISQRGGKLSSPYFIGLSGFHRHIGISSVSQDFTGISGFHRSLRIPLVYRDFTGENSPPRLRGGVWEGQYGMMAEEIESFLFR